MSGLIDAAAVVVRMCAAFDLKRQGALAAQLGLDVATLSSWKNRGSISLEHLIRTSIETGRSLDWIVFGRDRAPIVEAAAEAEAIAKDLRKIVDKVEALSGACEVGR